jgi:hypothetical protein
VVGPRRPPAQCSPKDQKSADKSVFIINKGDAPIRQRCFNELWATSGRRIYAKTPDACSSPAKPIREACSNLTGEIIMMSHTFKLSAISFAAVLAACGGGSDDPVTEAAAPAPAPVVVSVAPTVEPALDAAKAFLAKYDALLATAVPATGAAFTALSDGCFLADGRSRAYTVADFDADPLAIASRQFLVGTVRSNVKVLAERNSTNADGTSRREIDIKYDIAYKDGSKFESPEGTVLDETIISGSSAGAKLADGSACATPDSKSDWRFYGNRKVVRTLVTASNERIERTSLATGLPLSPAVVYNKNLNLTVQDPANVATYAIVTGPGLSVTTTGAVGSLKLISVRVLRTATELVGKPGNVVDWRDTDSWRTCQNAAGNNGAAAETADCVANGANIGNTWGFYNNASGAALDTSFATLNIKAGDAYTIAVYNDDGWKTVNGQLGKTPIATYTNILRALPFSAATLAGTGPTGDLFARFTSSTKTAAEMATAIRTKAAISTDVTLSALGAMPDGRVQHLADTYVFEQGNANTAGVGFPRSRQIRFAYPGAQATSATFAIPVPVTALVVPTFASTAVDFNNRNGNNLLTSYAYQ